MREVEPERHVHVRVEERRGALAESPRGPPHLPDVLEVVAWPAEYGTTQLEAKRPEDHERQSEVEKAGRGQVGGAGSFSSEVVTRGARRTVQTSSTSAFSTPWRRPAGALYPERLGAKTPTLRAAMAGASGSELAPGGALSTPRVRHPSGLDRHQRPVG